MALNLFPPQCFNQRVMVIILHNIRIALYHYTGYLYERYKAENISLLLSGSSSHRHNTLWYSCQSFYNHHYNDVRMSMIAFQIAGASIVYSNVCSDVDQRKHQSSVSLAFVRGIHRWPVNSPHKGPVTWKMIPFDDVIMTETRMLSESQLILMT